MGIHRAKIFKKKISMMGEQDVISSYLTAVCVCVCVCARAHALLHPLSFHYKGSRPQALSSTFEIYLHVDRTDYQKTSWLYVELAHYN